MAPNPPGKPRGVWPLLVLARVSGLITITLSAPNSDATREAGADDDMSRLLFNSPIQTPRPIGVITDEALARVLDERRHAYPQPTRTDTPTSTPQRTATVTRTPDDVRTITPPVAVILSLPQTTQFTYLPHVNVFYGWKGVCNALDEDYTWPNTSHLNNFNLGWWYDWGYNNDYGEYDHLGFVPMVWCGFFGNSTDPLRALVAQHPGRTWLVFNEPDHPAIKLRATPIPSVTPGVTPTAYFVYRQCAEVFCANTSDVTCQWGENVTPAPDLNAQTQKLAVKAAQEYARVYMAIKEVDPTARVLCCGQYHADRTNWWVAFITELRRLRDGDATTTPTPSLGLDGIHLHVYPYTGSTECNSGPLNEVVDSCLRTKLPTYVAAFRATETVEVGDRPFWITEYGYLYGPPSVTGTPTPTPSRPDVRDYLMKPMAGFMGSSENPGYRRLAWFSVADGDARTRLMEPEATGTPPYRLTILGNEWASYDPAWPPTPTITPTYTPTP